MHRQAVAERIGEMDRSIALLVTMFTLANLNWVMRRHSLLISHHKGKILMARKTEFWWASIAGADPEPVEKTEHEGRPCVFTCGCADPFYLDDPEGPVRLMTWDWATRGGSGSAWKFADGDIIREGGPVPLERPEHPDKKAAAYAAARFERPATLRPTGNLPKRRTYYHPGDFTHGWRGPR